MNIQNPEDINWDVIVVGTGMAGATCGYALAKAGKKVLFCEMGKSSINGRTSLYGDYAETFFKKVEAPQTKHKKILKNAGRYFEEIIDSTGAKNHRFIPFIGAGSGGSSALYGMALERFFPSDFAPAENYPDTHNSMLPDTWPITYQDLKPYYKTAELLFRVRGEADPLRFEDKLDHFMEPPSISSGSGELFNYLQEQGLHPYRLPLACEYVEGCNCCQGFLCDNKCKNDSSKICLEPAINKYGATLLDECVVLKLETINDKIAGVRCFRKGSELYLKGKIIVLAAGALQTPRILLSSASNAWPDGVANRSGLVGRTLMRHYVDLFAITPKTKEKYPVSLKEFAFNDFYMYEGKKLGTIQSFGALPPPAVLAAGLAKDLEHGPLSFIGPLVNISRPLLQYILKHMFAKKIILASVVEDLPYSDNLVGLEKNFDSKGRRELFIKYQIRQHDRQRISLMRQKIKQVFKAYNISLIKQAENNERIAHACGTCRFGNDPRSSVLNINNRAHDISNLYVIDSSFFPSSGGTNPGLTIAANALRVAENIIEADE